MKNIVYLTNYMSEKIMQERKNKRFYSQAGNNKVIGIVKSITATKNKLTVISGGLINNKSFRKYQKVLDCVGNIKIVYSEIIDIPFINTISSMIYTYKNIKELNKIEPIDNIIFYNYKPEVAFSALLAKKNLGIPITIEYEDGYKNVKELGFLKKLIFNCTENIVSKHIDSAILVNSLLEKNINVPSVVVRGVIDEKFFKECQNYKKIKNEKFTIVYTGGLDKARGIDILLKSLNEITFDYELIITGKGNIRFNNEKINFKGFVSHNEMKKIMMQADVLIQCQLMKKEFSEVSFPSKIFEYIATENYIVSSKVADIEIFSKDEILYYENDNPTDLAKKIEIVYQLWKKGIYKNNKLTKLCYENMPNQIGAKIIDILK